MARYVLKNGFVEANQWNGHLFGLTSASGHTVDFPKYFDDFFEREAPDAADLRARVADLERRLAEAVEALKPFAGLLDEEWDAEKIQDFREAIIGWHGQGSVCYPAFTAGDVRRAASVAEGGAS